MFQNLRTGSVVYILQKDEPPKLKKTTVSNITSSTGFNNYLPQTIDIQVKIDDTLVDFKQLPGQLSVANYENGKTIISDSKDIIIQEVNNMINNSQQILNSIPYHQSVLETGEQILRQLNPELARQKDQEDKINNLESKIGGIENKLDDICSMLSQKLK